MNPRLTADFHESKSPSYPVDALHLGASYFSKPALLPLPLLLAYFLLNPHNNPNLDVTRHPAPRIPCQSGQQGVVAVNVGLLCAVPAEEGGVHT